MNESIEMELDKITEELTGDDSLSDQEKRDLYKEYCGDIIEECRR